MRRLDKFIRAGGCTAVLALLLSGGARAEEVCEPCFTLPYFTLDSTPTGKIKNKNFQFTATVGETEVDITTTNNRSHSMATGFWSFYLAEPLPPIVEASDGDHQDHIEVSWTIVDDQVGPPVTEKDVLLYRNGTILTTLPLIQTQYQDFNVFPGAEYEYAVVPGNKLGRAHREAETGFLNPNGAIIGQVETPNGNPVNEVKVVLTPNLGRAAEFGPVIRQDGLREKSYIYFPEMFEGLEQGYTIEGWFRSRSFVEQTLFSAVDSATTRPFVRIGLTSGGELKWEHQGGTSNAPDMVTTRDGYTSDAKWHHFAAVLADSNLSMTLYVDGRIVGRGTAADTIGTQRTQIVLGKKGPSEHEQYLQGRLDDWRIWSVPRTRAEIRRDMDRTLEGDEGGLEAYWKFDEVKGEKVFDLTANDNDGIVCKVERSDFKAPVFVSGVTDTLGHYAIKGIYYGAGTTFTATPQKVTPIGTALDFDGADDYLDFAQDRLDLTGGYTLEGWFKNPGTSGAMTIFAAEDPADHSNHVNLALLADGRLQLTHGNVAIATTQLYDDEFWYHFAAAHDTSSGKLAFYINGELVGEQTGVAAIGALSAFVIGRQAPGVAAQYFRGWLDEIRVWDRGRTLEQISAVRNQFLSGSETGMIAYWHFNEGNGVLALDATGANLTGDLAGGASWSSDIPLNEVFVNTFDSESRQVILNPSNTSVDRVDFTDISQIAVTGFVKYSGTACFIEGAEILVNGKSLVPPRLTDENGRFVVEFEPGARRQQISVKYRGHDIAPASIELPTIVKPITGLFFEDTVKREISGIVAGGACRLPITPSQGQIEVEVSTTDGCFTASAVPDPATGLYAIRNVPPVIYNLNISHPNPEIDAFFAADTLSVEEGNRSGVDFIYRAPPQVAVTGFPLNDCGLRTFSMAHSYPLAIDIFEEYTSQGQPPQRCAVDNGSVQITNFISGVDSVRTFDFSNGQTTHTFIAGVPNILGGGAHPFQKNIQVTATDNLGRNATVEEWAYVQGRRVRSGFFVTTLPETPYLILREPPGDGSRTVIEKGTELQTSKSFYASRDTTKERFVSVHLGPDFEFTTGVFVSVNTILDITADFNNTWTTTVESSYDTTLTYTFTANETFSTAGGGDVFIGGAQNMRYGIADVLRINPNTCQADITAEPFFSPGDFATTFIFSEDHIRNTLIPALQVLGALYVPKPTEEQERIAIQTDSSFAAARRAYLSTQRWRNILSRNDSLKTNAVFKENISFDAGAEFERSVTTQSDTTFSFDSSTELDATFGAELGLVFNGVGATGGFNHQLTSVTGASRDSTRSNSQTTSYVLADDDLGDHFSINIKDDRVYGPVFEVVGGVSSCPWEPGTVKVDQPTLSVSPSQRVDVDPLTPAVFNLSLGNTSESGADRTYDLRVANESNPNGAAIAFNGVRVEDKLSFDVPFGQAVQAVMEIFRGPVEYQYDDLLIRLMSACESDIFDEVAVSAHYTVPCSEVKIAAPETGFTFTAADTGSGHQIQVTLNGYDRLDPNLQRLELQYRPASGGDWFVAATVPKAQLTEDFKLVNWNISPSIVADNSYELRAQAICGIGRVPGTSPVIAGTIDRTGPRPLGAPQPSDGILHASDEIAVLFNEPINCGGISIGAGDIALTNAVTGEGIDFDYTCGDNQVVIDPNIQNTFMENLTLRATVGPVADFLGNHSPQPVEWEFFVNRNPIEWAGLDLEKIVIFAEQSFSTTRLLQNNGGSPRSFTFTDVDIAQQAIVGPRPISIPPWLRVEPQEGTIQPGAALEVSFSVDGPTVGAGSYQTTLYASGGLGEEPRAIDIRVLSHPPVWGEVNPAAYQQSMTLTATLATDGELSQDEYDRVGVFIDGQLRGLATVEFIPVFAQLVNTPAHQVFLTIYGNQEDNDKALELRVWDASASQELGRVVEQFKFTANARLGTPTNPQTITATSQIISQYDFPAGWTWFSLNLIPDDPAVNAVFGGLGASSGDLVRSQYAFSQFVEGAGWFGSLQTLDNQSMYLLRLAKPAKLEVVGYAVDVETTSIPIKAGWNWISYLPQHSMEVNRALESLPAQTGDIIKSQFSFAQFIEGRGWIGSLHFLRPQQAYQLFSQQAGTLRYPFFEAPVAKPVAEEALPQVATLGWQFDPRGYKHSMVLVAEVVGEDGLDSDKDAVAAFVGDEVRGVGQTVYVPEEDRHLAFVAVYSNAEGGEVVDFRFYDGDGEREGFVPTAIDFAADGIVGSAAQPLALETRARRMGDRGFVPNQFVLSQAYPNPFNPAAKIGYGLLRDGAVEIAIYNTVGQKIHTLVSGHAPAGYYYAVWDGRDDRGHGVPSGVYFAVMRADNFRAIQKLMLLK